MGLVALAVAHAIDAGTTRGFIPVNASTWGRLNPDGASDPRVDWAMAFTSLHFRFRQTFRVPARAAYEWCTDYRTSDARLFEQKWRREVRRLTEDALILTETTWPRGRPRVIRRLVRLSPRDLSWTNTHISGPFRHSQYWYCIVPDGPRRCHLVFTGLRLIRTPRPLSASEKTRRAEQERLGDARLWRDRIAPVLQNELAN